MREKITPYLHGRLSSAGIAAQYVKRDAATQAFTDPLNEEAHEVVKGLVHKYNNRALIKVSYQCAAHCRFCTRARQIGDPGGTLTPADFPPILEYLSAHPEIDEVILSGGDPLYTPQLTLALLTVLSALPQIKIFRLGTRLPLQLPAAISAVALQPLLAFINELGATRPCYLLLHINHPDELTEQSMAAIAKLHLLRTKLLSQTVFLRGINDDFETLHALFTRLYHAGIIPYYLYHCDAVQGMESFVVPLEKEQEIVTRLHATLSGIAVPRHVLDVEDGYGKLSVPQLFLDANLHSARDYNGVQHPL